MVLLWLTNWNVGQGWDLEKRVGNDAPWLHHSQHPSRSDRQPCICAWPLLGVPFVIQLRHPVKEARISTEAGHHIGLVFCTWANHHIHVVFCTGAARESDEQRRGLALFIPCVCLDGVWERWSLVPRLCLECWSPSVPRRRLELWSLSVPPQCLKTKVFLPKSKMATRTGCMPCVDC